MNKLLSFLFFIFILSTATFAQDDIQIGSPNNDYRNQRQGGLFDYSDPSSINIKVQLWGYVKYPGYYIIPASSTVNDLISFGGGPTSDALLDDIRLFKINTNDSSQVMVKLDYDLMWQDSIKTKITLLKLQAGNIVVVPGEPRYFLRQDISFYMSFATALASVAALIISLIK